jgi:hypothetical protein
MKVYEGAILTCDDARSVRKFLVEDRGRIAYTGDSLPEAYAGAQRIDLGRGALCPAFADTHLHFMSHALFLGGLDLRAAPDIGSAARIARDFADAHRDKILIGFGASAHSVAEGRLIERADLDKACPDRPLFIVKYDGHAAIINRALLALLPDSVKSARGFAPESGLMTQEAFFRVTDFVTGSVSLPATLGGMLRAVDAMAAKGIGMIHSVSGVGFPGDLDVTLESLFARGLRNALPYRIFFQTMDAAKVLKRKLPRIGGCFATALDGCYGSEDAALLEPYANDPRNRGLLYYDDETVEAFAKRANRAGLQIEMHAIGDRAFEQAVGALTAALADFPRADHRHTIIHACLPTKSGLETCARLGIGIALQPAFLHWEQEPLEYLERIMGDRERRISPLRTMRDLGIRMSGGSDAPCTEPDPIRGIWAAANHYVEEESLKPQEALDLYTRDAAWTSFDEKERGSLERGKLADMVILDRNILAIPKAEIKDARVLELLLEGNPYKPGQGRASLLARGLVSRRMT